MALRVLLADESLAIRKVFQLSLQDYAAEVKAVHHGSDVLEVAKNFKPDIIFADILLQKKNGYEVASELKKDPILRKIPIVLMWSGFLDFDEKKFSECKANHRLEKPFDVATLRKMVQSLVVKTQTQPLSAYLEFPHLEFEEDKQPDEEAPQRTLSNDKNVSASIVTNENLNLKSFSTEPGFKPPLFEMSEEDLKSELKLDSSVQNPSSLSSLPEGLNFPATPDEEDDHFLLPPIPLESESTKTIDISNELPLNLKKDWTMDSFESIESFVANKISQNDHEDFARIDLSAVRADKVAPQEHDLTQVDHQMNEHNKNEFHEMDELNKNGLHEHEIEQVDEIEDQEAEWSYQSLSKFRLDLPESVNQEESRMEFVIPDSHNIEDDRENDEKILSNENQRLSESSLSQDKSFQRLQKLESSEEKIQDLIRDHEESINQKNHLNFNEVHQISELNLEEVKEETKTISFPQSHPLSKVEIEKIVREQCKEIIESVVWKVVPELAHNLVREELDRLLKDDQEDSLRGP